MFMGTYTPKLDAKGRLFLPAKFRDQLEAGLVVTRGQERCLNVYPAPQFQTLVERLSGAPLTNKGVRDYVRMFASGAFEETPDKQGRITIPPLLRGYASLTKDVVVIGSLQHVEIWDPTSWADYVDHQEPEYAGIGEEVFPGI